MVYLVYERPLVVGRAERGGNIKTTPKNPAVAVQILSSSQIRGPFEDEKTIVNKKHGGNFPIENAVKQNRTKCVEKTFNLIYLFQSIHSNFFVT